MLSSERERLLKALVPVRYCHVVEKKVRERERERGRRNNGQSKCGKMLTVVNQLDKKYRDVFILILFLHF